MIDKAKMTDVVSIALIGVSYLSPEPYRDIIRNSGLFAISGAVTNQLAIYMLFEKVPLLYGSGVIERNFDKFKDSIRKMIKEQFFTQEKIDSFLREEERSLDLAPLVESADFSPAFDALKQSIMESKFGSMIQMIGGEEALEPLRSTFSRKLKGSVVSIVSSDMFKAQIEHHLKHSSLSKDITDQIDTIVTKRLDEMTPKIVKNIVQNLIREHMGWLVVWGGVLGALIGAVSSLLVK